MSYFILATTRRDTTNFAYDSVARRKGSYHYDFLLAPCSSQNWLVSR